MQPAVGVLVVHGMGAQDEHFAEDFVARLEHQCEALGLFRGTVVCRAGFWADLLEGRQRRLLAELTRHGPLDWAWARRFVFSALGDAIAYRRTVPTSYDMYAAIHWRIHEHLQALRAALGDRDLPLVVVAHSLGSVIMSDHIWDEQHGQGFGRDPLDRMETLAGLITCGSTIPLFTLALESVEAIRFPVMSPQLAPAVSAIAKWLNLYDRDDVLGYPLKPISDSYRQAVTADIEVNVGSVLTSWNPASHLAYWRDRGVMRHTAELVKEVAVVQQAERLRQRRVSRRLSRRL